jgi:hypothetical protein
MRSMTDVELSEAGPPARFVPLTRVGDVTAAGVLAARLRAEGIEVRLHSQAFGPYPVTVGHLAETELWVLSDRVEEASRILLDAEVNEAMYAAETEDREPIGMPFEVRLLALGLGVVLLVLFVLRFARVY